MDRQLEPVSKKALEPQLHPFPEFFALRFAHFADIDRRLIRGFGFNVIHFRTDPCRTAGNLKILYVISNADQEFQIDARRPESSARSDIHERISDIGIAGLDRRHLKRLAWAARLRRSEREADPCRRG